MHPDRPAHRDVPLPDPGVPGPVSRPGVLARMHADQRTHAAVPLQDAGRDQPGPGQQWTAGDQSARMTPLAPRPDELMGEHSMTEPRALAGAERRAVIAVAVAVGLLGLIGFANSFARVATAARPTFGAPRPGGRRAPRWARGRGRGGPAGPDRLPHPLRRGGHRGGADVRRPGAHR